MQKNNYLRAQFYVMNRDFRQLTQDLIVLTDRLKSRCLAAEERVRELEQQIGQQQQRIAQLEEENQVIDTKYQNLQTGLAATGRDPQQVARLKEQYLAMVSEIDACIDKLQHG